MSQSRRQRVLTASTEINAPNLNSRKHSLMDPPGICAEPLPFSSLIYLSLSLSLSLFVCGTHFLIIRLRITRPVGEDDFLSCHTKQYCFYHVFFSLGIYILHCILMTVSPDNMFRLHSWSSAVSDIIFSIKAQTIHWAFFPPLKMIRSYYNTIHYDLQCTWVSMCVSSA